MLNEAQKEREQDEWIESQIEHLMSPGQKCDPMNADNILESLTQMDEANLELFAGYVRKAAKHVYSTDTDAHIAISDFIIDNCQEYWLDCATFLAKRDWEERIV